MCVFATHFGTIGSSLYSLVYPRNSPKMTCCYVFVISISQVDERIPCLVDGIIDFIAHNGVIRESNRLHFVAKSGPWPDHFFGIIPFRRKEATLARNERIRCWGSGHLRSYVFCHCNNSCWFTQVLFHFCVLARKVRYLVISRSSSAISNALPRFGREYWIK